MKSTPLPAPSAEMIEEPEVVVMHRRTAARRRD
jgi:hypothetical protein